MANTLVTSSIVAEEGLAVLENLCTFGAAANRDWEDTFQSAAASGYKPGATINIRKPARYTYRAGRVSAPQDTVESTVPLTLSQGGCDLSFSAVERTLSLTRLEDKLTAALATVANEIDNQGLTLAHYASHGVVNPAGALPTTQATALQVFTDANTLLDERGAPRKDRKRYVVMNPKLNGAAIQGLAGLFNSAASIGKQYDGGMMVDSLGFNVSMDQNVDVHTNGTQNVAGTNVSGAGQSGAAITVVGLGGTITRGTVVTFPGCYAVNPQTRKTTGSLAQFVITADLIAGATSLPISPAIVLTGAFQNVSAAPTTGSPFLIVGAASTAYGTNIAFHKDAFTLAMAPLWTPPSKNVVSVSQKTHNGFTIRVLEYYDGKNDESVMRLDVLFGWAATYPELSAKIYTV
jgi:hypothetical protein